MKHNLRLSFAYKVAYVQLRCTQHKDLSISGHPQKLRWWQGYAVGPTGIVAVYAQDEGNGTSFAQFRVVRDGVEFCYRKAWNVPLSSTRPIARAAGQVLRLTSHDRRKP